MAQIKAVIFDLDGTVCNTLQDLAECTNRALADYGLPGHTVEAYKKIVGNGVDTQMRRAIGEEKYTKELADKVKAAFKAYYDQDYLKNTKPYEGMPQALDELKAMGLKIAVFSNKPDEFAGKVCTALFGDRFDLVAGNRPGIPVKPDPAGLFLALEKLGVTPEECVYCGDSCVDMDTGKNAGILTVGVEWGFRDRKELEEHDACYLLQSPSQLPDLLRRLMNQN